MKLKSFKMFLTTAILTGLSGSISFGQSVATAGAYIPPTPIPPIIVGIGAGSGPTLDTSLNPILNNMNVGINAKLIDIGQYLHGNENMGNGLIELLMSMNAKMAQQNAFSNNQGKADDMAARVRLKQEGDIQDAIARGVAMNGSTMRNVEQACEEMTYASGRGSAASGTVAAKNVLNQVFDENIQDSRSPLNTLGRLYTQHTSTYCSEADVTNGRVGCSTVGDYPGADIQASTLTDGALAKGATSSNLSFNADQVKAALAYINTITPIIPEDPNKANMDTPDGKMYTTEVNRYRGRVSDVTTGYIDSLALKAQPGAIAAALGNSKYLDSSSINTNQLTNKGYGVDGKSDWSSIKDKYTQIFGLPASEFPQKPSEWEVLRYDVFSRYADAKDKDSWQAQVGSFTEQQALQELDRMAALNLRLVFMNISQQQETNRLLSLIAINQLDPTTKQALLNQRNGLTDTNQTK